MQAELQENQSNLVGESGQDGAAICTSVCTPLDEVTLEAAIARLTIALTTAADEELPGLVAERRALREELHALREGDADVVRLDDERARREPKG